MPTCESFRLETLIFYWVLHNCLFYLFFSDWCQALAKQQNTTANPIINWSMCRSLWWTKRHAIIQSLCQKGKGTFKFWQTTCFVLDYLKVGRTPAMGIMEVPLPWGMTGGSGLLELSAGGMDVDSRDDMDSIPELLTTWTGSWRLCRRTECSIIHY